MPAAIAANVAAAPKAPRAVTVAAAAAAADAVFVLPDAAAPLPAALPDAAAPASSPSVTAATKTPVPKATDIGRATPDSTSGQGTLAWLLSALSGPLAPSAAPPVGDQLPNGAPAQNDAVSAGHEQSSAARAGAAASAHAEPPPAAATQPVLAGPAGQAGAASPQLPRAGMPAVTPAAATAPIKPAEAPAVQAAANAADSSTSPPAQIAQTGAVAAGFPLGANAGAAPAPGSQPPPAAHPALDLTQANWPTALAEHVHWQILDGVQEARMELNPRELGSVQIHVRLSGNETQVQFAAIHPQMREVLNAGLPQLRALLADGGLQLSQAQVGGQGQSPRQGSAPWVGGSRGEALTQEDEAPVQARLSTLRVGLVDDFA